MDQIKEIVMSWRAMDIINIASEDEDVIKSLIKLLGEGDATIRLRALTAIGELIKNTDGKVKSEVLKMGLGRLLDLLRDSDGRIVSRALEVLSKLLEGMVINDQRLLALINASIPLAERGDTFVYLSLLELFRGLQVPSPSERVREIIDDLLSSNNLYVRGLGMRLLLSSGGLDGNEKTAMECAVGLLTSDNALLMETGLNFLEETIEFHPTPRVVRHLPGIINVLEDIENDARSSLLRSRASKLRDKVEKILLSYYRSRREEALEAIRKLLVEGRVEEALNLTLILGGKSLLNESRAGKRIA